jgi:hypothetical protein
MVQTPTTMANMHALALALAQVRVQRAQPQAGQARGT